MIPSISRISIIFSSRSLCQEGRPLLSPVYRSGICRWKDASSGLGRLKQALRMQCGMETWVPPRRAGLRTPGGGSLNSFSFSKDCMQVEFCWCGCACVYTCRSDSFYFRLNICCSLRGGSNQGGREWKTWFFLVLFMGWQVAFSSSDFPNSANPHLPTRSLKI